MQNYTNSIKVQTKEVEKICRGVMNFLKILPKPLSYVDNLLQASPKYLPLLRVVFADFGLAVVAHYIVVIPANKSWTELACDVIMTNNTLYRNVVCLHENFRNLHSIVKNCFCKVPTFMVWNGCRKTSLARRAYLDADCILV